MPRFAVCCVLGLFVVSGCSKATREECSQSCTHIVNLQQESERESMRLQAHEMEEAFELQEREQERNIERVKKEMAIPRPKFEETLEGQRKVPAATRKLLYQKYVWEGEQLEKQREEMLKATTDGLAESRKKIAEAKKKAEEMVKKRYGDALTKCMDDCSGKRSKRFVQCILAAQSPDDSKTCEKR